MQQYGEVFKQGWVACLQYLQYTVCYVYATLSGFDVKEVQRGFKDWLIGLRI